MGENKSLNARLHEKISSEQDSFREWLLGQPPGEILRHAYEYSVREDILMAMESTELTEPQTEALLKSPAPLSDIYRIWEKRESGQMEEIASVIEERANALIKESR